MPSRSTGTREATRLVRKLLKEYANKKRETIQSYSGWALDVRVIVANASSTVRSFRFG